MLINKKELSSKRLFFFILSLNFFWANSGIISDLRHHDPYNYVFMGLIFRSRWNEYKSRSHVKKPIGRRPTKPCSERRPSISGGRKRDARYVNPDSKIHGAHIGSIWGRQHPGGPHVGPMEDKDPFVIHIEWYGGWWPSHARTKAIISHGTGQVLPEYSGFITRGFAWMLYRFDFRLHLNRLIYWCIA